MPAGRPKGSKSNKLPATAGKGQSTLGSSFALIRPSPVPRSCASRSEHDSLDVGDPEECSDEEGEDESDDDE